MRVLDGKGLSDGYIAWFNGSPFAWPVLAAVGHRLGGLTGARLVAVKTHYDSETVFRINQDIHPASFAGDA